MCTVWETEVKVGFKLRAVRLDEFAVHVRRPLLGTATGTHRSTSRTSTSTFMHSCGLEQRPAANNLYSLLWLLGFFSSKRVSNQTLYPDVAS
ncbi:hypothetical protein LshimejAT787_0506490 [Lyophyllum shimeji]|uniref:Uncharacterized protein n=1 Tax=Lyophyllum shimeji TaxID=47721 RepID=A0A9P3UL27_LYOSH|nr:hypothetical protein LshimejAT787_0506490 [Lyophyllum shimeji]